MKGYQPPWSLLSSHGIPYEFERFGRVAGRWELDPWPLAVGPDDPPIVAPIVAFADIVRWHGRRSRRQTSAVVTPTEIRDTLHERLGIDQPLWPFSFQTIADTLRGAGPASPGQWSRLVCRAVPHAVDVLKWALLSSLPLACGFACTEIMDDVAAVVAGELLPPRPDETLLDGSCAVLCGWDDERSAFRCRAVQGASWGEGGYGWIPYSYVTRPQWVHEVVALVDL